MPVPCPAIAWPGALDECGPPEDPTILLVGRATVADAEHVVVAVRVARDLRCQPDYRPDVDATAYDEAMLDSQLEELGYLANTISPTVVDLGPGRYVLWLTPANAG